MNFLIKKISEKRAPRAYFGMRFFAIIFAFFFLISNILAVQVYATAGVPKILNFQGRLMNSSGSLLGGSSGTNYCYKFAIYDSATGGTKLWPAGTPTTMTILTTDGVFDASVGGAGGDTLTYDFQTSDTTYMDVQVSAIGAGSCTSGDESFESLSPRPQIVSAAYAINSGTVGGFTPAQSATNDQIPVLTSGALILSHATTAGVKATGTNALTFQSGVTGDIQFFSSSNKITSAGALTIAGLMTSTGLTTSGANVSINDNSNFTTNINTGTSNTLVSIGGGSGTFALNTTNIDISGGAITGATGITSATGDITATAGNIVLGATTRISNAGVGTFITGTVIGSQTFTTNNIADSGSLTIKSASGSNDLTLDSGTVGIVNLGTGNNAKTLNIGTGNAGNTINIGTNNTVLDTINIGSALDNVAITGDDWSVTNAGAGTFASLTEGGTSLASKYAPINSNFITVTSNGTLTGETGIDALTTAISTTNTLNVDSSSTLNTVTIDGNANLILASGTGKIQQTFTTATAVDASAITYAITNAGAGITSSGLVLTPTNNTAPSSGTNTLNVINFPAGTGGNAGNLTTNGINFASATGYKNFLNTPSIVISSAGAITGATGFNGLVVTANTGVITTGTWQGTVIDSTYGGTGVNNGGRTLTINTNSGTLAFGAASKTLTINNSITLSGTDSTTMTFPSTSATIARTDAGQTFTGVNTFTSPSITTSITTGSTSFDLFNTTATTLNIGGEATTLALGGTPTTSLTANIFTNATASGQTKTINIGTGGAASSTTNVSIGSSNGGTTTISSPSLTISGTSWTATPTISGLITATSGLTSNGTVTVSGFTNANGVVYASSSGVLAQTATNAGAILCLTQTSSAAPVWGSCAGASGARLDQIAAANTTNTINNATFAQQWNWGTLTTQTGLTLGGGTNAGLTTGTIFAIGNTNYSYTHAANETGSLATLTFKDVSSSVNTTTTNGLLIQPIINTTGASTGRTFNGISIASPSTFACGTTGGTCTSNSYDFSTASLTQSTTNTFNINGLNLGTAGALTQNTAAGIINWKGVTLQMPALTQTTGTVNVTGLEIVTSTVATQGAGTQRAINVKDASGNSIFSVKDMGTADNNFGALAETGAFVSNTSYFAEEFNADTLDTAVTADSAVVGDNGTWYADTTSALFTISQGIDRTNGTLRAVSTNTAVSAIEFALGQAQNVIQKPFVQANLPVVQFKMTMSNVTGTTSDMYIGILDTTTATATNDTLPTNGVYFTNNNTGNWVGQIRAAGATVGTTSSCGAQTTTATVFRIEVISATVVRFLIDTNATDGISFTDCGTITGTGPSVNLGPAMTFIQTDTANDPTIDLDYFRVWQDDPEGSSSDTPLQIEQAAAHEYKSFNAKEILADLMTGLDSSTKDGGYADRLDIGRLVAGVEIVTPTITTNSISVDSIISSDSGKITIGSPVEFTVPPLFNKDTAGFAIIKEGDRRVHISFDEPYISTPIVNTSIAFEATDNIDDTTADDLFNQDIRYVTLDKDQNGFTILLNKSAPRNIRFSWTAFGVNDPHVFESVIEGITIDQPTASSSGGGSQNTTESTNNSETTTGTNNTTTDQSSTTDTDNTVEESTVEQPAEPTPSESIVEQSDFVPIIPPENTTTADAPPAEF